jgi:MFS family permease
MRFPGQGPGGWQQARNQGALGLAGCQYDWPDAGLPADLVVTDARRRPLAVLLAANVISITGSSLTLIGVPWFVLQSTGSAADAGIVAFCALLPVALAALAGGPLVDRLGRRRVSIVSDLVGGMMVGAVPLLQFAGLLRFWMLCALMAVAGLFHAPGDTARGVLLPALAGRAGVSLTRAAGLYDGASRCAAMIGSAAGGVYLLVTLGPVLFPAWRQLDRAEATAGKR